MTTSVAPTSFAQVNTKNANEKVDNKDMGNWLRVMLARQPKHNINTEDSSKSK